MIGRILPFGTSRQIAEGSVRQMMVRQRVNRLSCFKIFQRKNCGKKTEDNLYKLTSISHTIIGYIMIKIKLNRYKGFQ